MASWTNLWLFCPFFTKERKKKQRSFTAWLISIQEVIPFKKHSTRSQDANHIKIARLLLMFLFSMSWTLGLRTDVSTDPNWSFPSPPGAENQDRKNVQSQSKGALRDLAPSSYLRPAGKMVFFFFSLKYWGLKLKNLSL